MENQSCNTSGANQSATDPDAELRRELARCMAYEAGKAIACAGVSDDEREARAKSIAAAHRAYIKDLLSAG